MYRGASPGPGGAGGEVFVSSSGDGRIVVYDLEGRFLRAIGGAETVVGHLERPMHIDVLTGRLYVPEDLADRVRIFTTGGDEVGSFGESGDGPGQLDAPAGVTLDGEGSAWVADFDNHRIQKLRPDGTFLTAFGSRGSGPGELDRPTDVAIGPDGRAYVVDFGNDRIQVFAAGPGPGAGHGSLR